MDPVSRGGARSHIRHTRSLHHDFHQQNHRRRGHVLLLPGHPRQQRAVQRAVQRLPPCRRRIGPRAPGHRPTMHSHLQEIRILQRSPRPLPSVRVPLQSTRRLLRPRAAKPVGPGQPGLHRLLQNPGLCANQQVHVQRRQLGPEHRHHQKQVHQQGRCCVDHHLLCHLPPGIQQHRVR